MKTFLKMLLIIVIQAILITNLRADYNSSCYARLYDHDFSNSGRIRKIEDNATHAYVDGYLDNFAETKIDNWHALLRTFDLTDEQTDSNEYPLLLDGAGHATFEQDFRVTKEGNNTLF